MTVLQLVVTLAGVAAVAGFSPFLLPAAPGGGDGDCGGRSGGSHHGEGRLLA